MKVFIDESGIHKKVDHSSFALVYVRIDNFDSIEKEIVEIERALNLKKFHWAETPWVVKEKFIQKILKLDFKVKIAIIKNPINPSDELERVLSHMAIEKNISGIFIDGKKPKWYERKIKKILRDKGVSARKVKTIDDDEIACARLADMIAGLSRSYFDRKHKEKFDRLYNMLEKKIVILIN
ncbi:MAG: DUF3800 domain-containing protein [Candidatus Moranbacteria bacterium]|nr:DUF3800 domain-containing protein [Candidatus Moranbacteria bacterium]